MPNDTIHATTHCRITTRSASRLFPISLFMEAIAATHGVYKRVNTKKLTADVFVNNPDNADASSDIFVPNNTLIVLTTASFAVNPVIREVEILQSPNPNGTNTGAIHLPSIASRLSALFATTLNLVSNDCKCSLYKIFCFIPHQKQYTLH